MRLKTIDLTKARRKSYGAYSGYYRLSKRRGVKVYGKGESYPEEGFANKGLLVLHADFDEAWREFDRMRECASRITPKAFEVVAVKLREGWFVGLVMEHVEGKELDTVFKRDTRTFNLILDKADRAFYKTTGYQHYDLHGGNVIYNQKTKRFKVIDFA